MAEILVDNDGTRLAGSDDGEGAPVVLLHGLTATRRYVVMGSTALQRSGHRVIACDARGHGHSDPAADPAAYTYRDLAGDAIAVLDALQIDRAVFAGASMGAHTLLTLVLSAPERVAGIVVVTPAFDPADNDDPGRLARWDALATGLRDGGVEGFVAAYGEPRVAPGLRETVLTAIRPRLAQHDHPGAVADALSAVPRSRPFGAIAELSAIGVPAAVVASSDEADPEHPVAIGEAYAAAIPGAELVTDEPDSSPVAWQGSRLSAVIASVAARAGV
jgi:pimeloyl-ACP methyl ester carboxylesterase